MSSAHRRRCPQSSLRHASSRSSMDRIDHFQWMQPSQNMCQALHLLGEGDELWESPPSHIRGGGASQTNGQSPVRDAETRPWTDYPSMFRIVSGMLSHLGVCMSAYAAQHKTRKYCSNFQACWLWF
eukprot:TRINITY_DN19078_c0_g1_i1.p3 TRINITY_DN19078_c0_g1~~TRINITY_DN19078_c0_g1_i1.p3  ORF type:complete len:126 (-),score=2.73 TRINITY_DN19078_c0_g1_i1:175-552(-)